MSIDIKFILNSEKNSSDNSLIKCTCGICGCDVYCDKRTTTIVPSIVLCNRCNWFILV